jgi:hypothetical protein
MEIAPMGSMQTLDMNDRCLALAFLDIFSCRLRSMIKSRLCRCLILFMIVYLCVLVLFLRSFDKENDDDKSTTSPLPHAEAHDNDKIVRHDEQKKIDAPVDIVAHELVQTRPSLEPFMTEGVLGNYEPRNVQRLSSPGEGGEPVYLVTNDEKKRGDESVSEYGFNEVASEKISLDRHARDTR